MGRVGEKEHLREKCLDELLALLARLGRLLDVVARYHACCKLKVSIVHGRRIRARGAQNVKDQ